MNKKKVLLILVDGMRPDAAQESGHPYPDTMAARGCCYPAAQTVMPSVTLPCHMSLFHSVPAERHGILTNTYVPMVRPLDGLFEVLKNAGKTCAAFYNWEPLRDLGRPGCMAHSLCLSMDYQAETDRALTRAAKTCLLEERPDFAFLYLGETDEAGHRHGWMTPAYMDRVSNAWDCIQDIAEAVRDTYAIVVTADHGGHERSHGADIPEDMTIPLFLCGVDAEQKAAANIMDIAPTIAAFLGVAPGKDWEGKSLL